jgi:2-dehydro-3-deoxygluconokinase
MPDERACQVVALGEPLIVMLPDRRGPLRTVPTFERGLAGAECNALLGMARLGASCGLISRLGDDEFGEFARETLRAGGVDVSRCAMDAARPTGIYFKERSALGADARPIYYRSGSAATALEPAHVDDDYLRGAGIVITTGITAMLSQSAYETVEHALRTAHEAGATTAFDPNLRPHLWGRERAAELLRPLLAHVDVYLGGERETEQLLERTGTPQDLAEEIRSLGPREVIIKRGDRGAVSLTHDGWHEEPPFRAGCEEPVGAGDAFNAGYLYFRHRGVPASDAMRVGAICASAVCASRGDFETFPRRQDLVSILGEDGMGAVGSEYLSV